MRIDPVPPDDVGNANDADDDVARLLGAMQSGDQNAPERLLPLIHAKLHKIAAALMRGERQDHTLQPTALVNEAYLRLVHTRRDAANLEIDGRLHFVRVAARAMRNVLIDHARIHDAEKRGGDKTRITLDADLVVQGDDAEGLLRVDETLKRLSNLDPQLGQIVELRFFGGLGSEEIATALGMSRRSVQRGWRTARAFLSKEIKGA
jgi:RNA polymerase sigma factor (TIGR02999 family)